MKAFLTLSAIFSAAAALPHGNHGHVHTHQPVYYGYPNFVPHAYHVAPQAAAAVLPYHSDAEANCHPETETFNVQSCLPSFEIKCEDATIQQHKITYVKKCTDVVSQICGNHHPVSIKVEETDDGNMKEVEETELPVENKVYFFAPGVPMVRHQCWDVPQEHCYLEPVVETESAVVPKCHVQNKAVCTETAHEVSKVVCNKEMTAEEVAEVENAQRIADDANTHEHADGVVHTHEGGQEKHDHKGDAVVSHTHADGTTHAHPAGGIPHEHEMHEHTHTHADGTTHSHPHADGHHAEVGEHSHEHAHADGTVHTHVHTPYHHVSPYQMYYYYPTQNLYRQLGIYNVVGK